MSEHIRLSLVQAEIHAVAATIMEERPECRPWTLVARFYAVIHLLNAYLVTTGQTPPGNHRAREQRLQGDRLIQGTQRSRLFGSYKQLRNLSEQVRYRAGFVPTESHYALSSAAQSDLEHIVRPYLEGTDPQTQRAG